MATKEKYIVNNNKKYELAPPDGGWGYMICVAAVIIFSATTMFMGSFGVIFNEFLIQLNMDSTDVALLNGVSGVCLAIAGYFTSSLSKIMSMRQIALLAAVLLNVGAFGNVFANSKFLFYLCQGPLMSSGMGLIYNVTCTVLNEYFYEKRLLSNSIAQTIAGISAMLAPQLVNYTLDEYGFRGTLIMTSGITLQIFIAVALMQPVEWHMRQIEVPENNSEEIKLLLSGDRNTKDAVITTPTITLTDTEVFETKLGIKEEKQLDPDKSTSRRMMQTINEMFDIRLLKKFVLSNASMGPTFCAFVDVMFTLMLPQALYAMNWDQDTVATAIMLGSLGDLVTRTSFIFLSSWLMKIGYQEIFIIGLIIAFVTRLCMLFSENTTLILVSLTFMGISRCTIAVLPTLILAEMFGPEDFTQSMGLFMVMFGIMNMILGPALGSIRDLTNSYPTVFYIITTTFAVVILLWVLELIYRRSKQKREKQLLAAEEMKNLKAKDKEN